MPAKSAKQERFMQAVAHNPKFAAEAGVPQSVGKEFTKKRFADGGDVLKPKTNFRTEMEIAKATGEGKPPPKELPSGGSLGKDMTDEEKAAWRAKRAKGPPASMFAKGGSIDGCAQRGKTRGRVV